MHCCTRVFFCCKWPSCEEGVKDRLKFKEGDRTKDDDSTMMTFPHRPSIRQPAFVYVLFPQDQLQLLGSVINMSIYMSSVHRKAFFLFNQTSKDTLSHSILILHWTQNWYLVTSRMTFRQRHSDVSENHRILLCLHLFCSKESITSYLYTVEWIVKKKKVFCKCSGILSILIPPV